ncbi:PPE domain-containing protein [Mycobacterium sp. SMC-4]|uniref:PPE domain-containing protein n=1 Tax=Mycobacterium sp. SMC-4 TaxID=2857059 RepID=UPI003D013A51
MSGDEVQVNPDDLHRKAVQIEGLTWADASAQAELMPPDALPVSSVAVGNLKANAAALWAHQQFGKVEGQRLAQTLHNVANAYAQVDQAAGQDIGSTMGGPGGPPADTTVYPQSVNIPAPPRPTDMPIPKGQPPPDEMLFPPQVQGALDAGDDGASLRTAAQTWRMNAQTLETSAGQFEVNSVLWEGEAADAAYRKFNAYRDWLIGLAGNWKRLAGEADRIVEAHERAQADHRPIAEEYQRLHDQVMGKPMGPHTMPAMERMAQLQKESEALRNTYARDGQPNQITPEDPPNPVVSGVPVTAEQHRRARSRLPQDGQGAGGGGGSPGAPAQGGAPQAAQEPSAPPAGAPPANPQVPQGGSPAGSPKEGGGAPGGAPSGGSPGGGAPAGGAPGGGMPGGGMPGGPKTDSPRKFDPALRPAAAGGGGAGAGGGGGGGIPAGPMQPAVGAETVAPTPVVAPVTPAAAAGAAGGGAAMGGGMGGMAPMMHGAQGNSGDKKRNPQLSEDEDLYTEDRPWTEPVIGNRPRRRGGIDDGKKDSQ